jgi:EVE domain
MITDVRGSQMRALNWGFMSAEENSWSSVDGLRRGTRRMVTPRSWVIVASRDHARRGVSGGFVMANHGKRAPLSRMSRGDGILIYSPTTTYPGGVPLRAITIVGEVTGEAPEPSDLIAGGFLRRASLREIEPLPLEEVRKYLPVSRIRFGFFELDIPNAEAIWALVDKPRA